MTSRPMVAAVLVACLCMTPAASARASVVVPLSLTDMTAAATLIVDGIVEDVRVVEGPSGLERMVQVRVLSAWKGHDGPVVYVRLAGGRMGRVETVVAGVPSPAPAARLIWFLVPHPRGGFAVVGLHQGALRVTVGADGQGHVLAPASVASSRGDLSRAPRRVDDVQAAVTALVRGQAAQ